jgi:hypothetical protein
MTRTGTKKLKTLEKKIKREKVEIPRRIFNSLNSHGMMGIIVDGNIVFDLHCLQLGEADAIICEYIVPPLNDYLIVTLITGIGKRPNEDGKGPLYVRVKVCCSLLMPRVV